jgi:hypothetical protein
LHFVLPFFLLYLKNMANTYHSMNDNDITHHIDRLKESFLCAAARGGRIVECASLLDLGAEIDWPRPSKHGGTSSTCHNDESFDTPLLAAVRNGHQDVTALLLAHGADPLRRSHNGDTVLHLAASSGDEGMASLFAPNAAILVAITNQEGMTAVDVAVARGYTSFAEFLSGLCEGRDQSTDAISEEDCASDSTSSNDSLLLSSNDSNDQDGMNSDLAHDESSDEGIQSSNCSTDFDIDETLHYPYHVEDGEEDRAGEVHDAGEVDGDDNQAQHQFVEDLNDQLQQMSDLAHSQSIELYQAKYALNEALQERDKLRNELIDLKALYGQGDKSNLGHKSLAELTTLEEQLKKSLDRILKAKEIMSSSLEEERTCVICRENPKTVLLMTCRHLCVCSECGQRDELVTCPLCREIIVDRIDVFQ